MKFQLTQVHGNPTKIQQLLHITGILLCYCSWWSNEIYTRWSFTSVAVVPDCS